MDAQSLKNRDLVSSADLTRAEYERVFATATELKREFRETRRHSAQPLGGRNVALIFEKQSLRTRVTFEAGLNQLGGHALHLGEGIGFGVRESVSDIAHNLDRWIDGIVIRTFDHSVVTELAAEAGIPVFNALTDDEHPFQALADLLAMREHFGSLEGRVLTFVGDGNNVFHSLALAGATLGMEIRLAHPAGFGPNAEILARADGLAAKSGGKMIWIADASGANLHRITTFRGPDVSPTWNPRTNAQLAWVSGRTGLPQIYTMDQEIGRA